ncbi:FAD/NAD(P)-binding domain-containing protein [Rhizodiscina lignyota]|uniref:FAD/NAD(P)-binding domain-containing protein n=1 Tax=Rhizodiscina lignyota TaxID=1504668 RepID=A0A9P4IBJ4_9PEZI|nr:FAD/NAD(P)-binding domain-containing protein [Rhizodiscina lignyota]
MPSKASDDFNIIIVGAGPSGLLLALLLAKQSIKVTILERSHEIDKQPRASFYSEPARHEFRRAGIMDDVKSKAFLASGVSWRHIDGTYICGIHSEGLPDDMRQVSLPLDELLPLIASHLEKYPSAEILLNHEVTGIGQDDKHAWVDVKTPDGEKKFSATYIIGCDGGNSKIRRELFGPGNFPGKTWDKQIVATNVYYPRLKEFNWTTSSNFMIDPKHFSMIAQISNDGMLRATYAEEGNLTREEMLVRQPEKYKAFVPGAPEPSEYKMVNFSPYKIHQRCAEKLRVGKFLLAADAAHLCNPFGGMGLTGGFADVGGLYDCLYGIYSGQADDSILDKYDEIRREKYWKVIDPISSGNIMRLWDPSPEAIGNDDFFNLLKKAEADKTGKMSRDMALGANTVMHDFTQYYRTKPAES